MIEIKLGYRTVKICGHSFLSKEPCARVTGYLDCFEMISRRFCSVNRSYGHTTIHLEKVTPDTESTFKLFTQGLEQLASFYPRDVKITTGGGNVLP